MLHLIGFKATQIDSTFSESGCVIETTGISNDSVFSSLSLQPSEKRQQPCNWIFPWNWERQINRHDSSMVILLTFLIYMADCFKELTRNFEGVIKGEMTLRHAMSQISDRVEKIGISNGSVFSSLSLQPNEKRQQSCNWIFPWNWERQKIVAIVLL